VLTSSRQSAEITKADYDSISLTGHTWHSDWNYTIAA
jgi:hypothetical protein